VVLYTKSFPNPNIYFKDLCFNVCESFYLWIYEEMKKQNSIVIMTLESNILKVLPGFGDALISIDKNCNEIKEWMDLDFEAWYEKKYSIMFLQLKLLILIFIWFLFQLNQLL
jgi:hypothetical protein